MINRRENGVPVSGHTSNGIPLGLISGTASIISGNTNVIVSHGLGVIPQDITVSSGDLYGADWHIDTITVSAFTIHIPAPQPSSAGFKWSVTP